MASITPLIVTFNCGRELVKPDVFAQHLINSISKTASPEIIILSLQEIAPIAYAFLGGSYLVAYLDRLSHTVELAAKTWGNGSYVSLVTRNLGMTVIMAFAKEDLSGHIQWMEAGGVGVGDHGLGNKGGVGLRLGYAVGDQTLEMTFVAAHLAPMEDRVKRRNEDWKDIVGKLVFEQVDKKATRKSTISQTTSAREEEGAPLLPETTDSGSTSASGIYTPTSYLFLAGDLNYRTSATKPSPDDYASWPQPNKPTDPHHFSNLLPSDQLTTEKKAIRTLHGLEEVPIDFSPTYKYSEEGRLVAERQEMLTASGIGSRDTSQEQTWLWAKHRWPSWCDRNIVP